MNKYNQKGFAHPVLLLVVIVAVSVVGYAGYYVYNANKDKQLSNSTINNSTQEALPADLGDILPVSTIKETAIGSNDVTVTGLELKSKNGALVYEVTLSDGTVVTLNAKTGTTIATAHEEPETGDGQLPADFTAAISFEQARKIAQDKFPDSKIVKIELEQEEGKVVYSVRFDDKARVDVNAANGSVVRTKDPKPEKKEKTSANPNASPNSNSKEPRANSQSKSGSSGSSSGSSSGNSGSGSSRSGSGSGSGSSSGSGSNDDNDDSGDDNSGSNNDDSGQTDDGGSDNSGSGSDSGGSNSGSGSH